MVRFRPLLLLVLAVPLLTGCLADQRKQLASCETAAHQRYPAGTPGQPLKAIQSCMDDAGYRFIGWRDGVVCDMGAVVRGQPSRTGTDAICFEPKNWLALKYYRLIEVPVRSQTSQG